VPCRTWSRISPQMLRIRKDRQGGRERNCKRIVNTATHIMFVQYMSAAIWLHSGAGETEG
jgi:hypothetical protein